MIQLPRKLFCAVEAVLYIAYNAGDGPVSSKEIADTQGLPPRYLEQLMQKLVRAGILRGLRGPRGGYVLARERRRISVADIGLVLEEGEEEDAPSVVTPLGMQVVVPLMEQAREAAIQALKEKTIAELCDMARAGGVRKRDADREDFHI